MNKIALISRYLVIVLLTIVLFQDQVFPCSCARSKTPAEEYIKREAVFVGKVLNIEFDGTRERFMQKKVTLEVIKSWKGIQGTEIVVFTGPHEAACGIDFVVDTLFLIYAHNNNDTLKTDLCTWTKTLSTAALDLAYLDPLSVKHIEDASQNLNNLSLNSYPNPANPSTIIRFTVPQTSFATINLFNINGQKVQTLSSGVCLAGVNELTVDLSNLSSGTYIATLQTGYGIISSKLTVLK
ncbi:MAG: T9SS type A sorting domain-containing protein [Bacteroidota bacterium]